MPRKAATKPATKTAPKLKKTTTPVVQPKPVAKPTKVTKTGLIDTSSIVKALHPRDLVTKYSGEEPSFPVQPVSTSRLSTLAGSFTWYHGFYGRKDAKNLLVQYLELRDRPNDAKVIRKVEDSQLNVTLCWLARMNLRGLELNEDESFKLENHIAKLIESYNNPQEKVDSKTGGVKKEVVKESNRPNVQELMKERAREAAGEIEGMYDDYVTAGAKAQFSFKPIDELSKKNVLPQHIYIFTDAWQKKKSEIEEAIKGKDPQVVEGYSHYTKTQLKNILKFIEQFLSDFNSYVSVKKAAKAPRARKAVPVERQVLKLKHLKTFKDDALKLDLVGLHPVKIYGASEAWVFDTAKRKLHHYVDDEYSKTFSVKGNTLLGFDSKQSEVKTLRKPAEQLKEIMGSKPAARKYFKDIKAVSTTPNGRFNESMIILKAF